MIFIDWKYHSTRYMEAYLYEFSIIPEIDLIVSSVKKTALLDCIEEIKISHRQLDFKELLIL